MKNAGTSCTPGPVTKNASQKTVHSAVSRFFFLCTMCNVGGNSGAPRFFYRYFRRMFLSTLLYGIVCTS
jgi:hypothetical protein